MRFKTCCFVAAASCALACAQTSEPAPKFEVADVHVTPKQPNPVLRTLPIRNGRSEWHNATMIDLIKSAYSVEADKIIGGPPWLEMNRYEVIGKFPDKRTELRKPMLQTLLADRFKLKIRQESIPQPAYVITAGKSPKLKEADGTGESGCKPQGSSVGPGEIRASLSLNGQIINLGAGSVITYTCRNMTMEAFAAGLRGMFVSGLTGTAPVQDQTGLMGAWNFEVKWSISLGMMGMENSQNVSVFDAFEKQLGLKLEQRQLPTPVILVDSVLETPTPNLPNLAELLPFIPAPAEFDVANVKPTDPAIRSSNYSQQPGGRLIVQGMPLSFLIGRAFYPYSQTQIIGMPEAAITQRFDITAKAPEGALGVTISMYDIAPMMKSLLEERFNLKSHMEQRTLPAYTLLAVKPKLKKADPAARTGCKTAAAPAGSPPGSTTFSCQNVTMDQFAEQLQSKSSELTYAPVNATELAGTWDISVTYSRIANMEFQRQIALEGGGGRGGAAPDGVGAASAPTGAISLLEAMEKQLGLKLEMQKRPVEVIVIDHIDSKPTEN